MFSIYQHFSLRKHEQKVFKTNINLHGWQSDTYKLTHDQQLSCRKVWLCFSWRLTSTLQKPQYLGKWKVLVDLSNISNLDVIWTIFKIRCPKRAHSEHFPLKEETHHHPWRGFSFGTWSVQLKFFISMLTWWSFILAISNLCSRSIILWSD